MSLSAVSIKRPVLAIVMSLVITLFGIIGYTFLGVREYPNVDPPIISVSATYTGANADVIETQITEPLEESISGAEGIRFISSVSREGRSNIRVEFNLNRDLEDAANDIRDRVSRAMGRLPPDADNPVVTKSDADAVPIFNLNVTSPVRDLLELTDIATNVIKEKVQTIPGVSAVDIWGARLYAMRLWIDPARLAAYNLTPLDIQSALRRENVELPSGSVEGMTTELTVRTVGRLETVDDFNNLIVAENNGQIIRFKDVGYAELGPENLKTIMKRDNIPMVGVVLIPQPGANYIAIVDEFYRRIDQISKDLPQDISLEVGFDSSKYIRDSITEVVQTVLLALILVILIIFAFLRNVRTTLIPVLAVPISLIGAFFIMYLAGFSINVLTLLGLVLAIGIVVDDAIVMLENIYTKIERGVHSIPAGLHGSKEVFVAIIATTLALVAVFLPVIFLQGLTGRLFREFGIVLAGAVIISAFVSLTLTPMLTTRILKGKIQHGKIYLKTEVFFQGMTNSYRVWLEYFLARRKWSIVFMGISLLMIVLFGAMLPSELSPLEDRGQIRLNSTAPEGATFDFMQQFMDQMVNLVTEGVPEKEGIISITSPGWGSASTNSGVITLILKDADQRQRSQQEIAADLSRRVSALSAARTFVIQAQSIGSRGGGLPVQYVLEAPTFEKLREVLPRFVDEARKDPAFQYVDENLKFNKPELRIEIDRQRARTLGVAVLDIAQTLQLTLSGQRFDYFIMNGKQYQVLGQMSRNDRDEPLDLKSLNVRNRYGQLVQLDNLVNISEQSSPPQRYRFNRFISATVSAGLAPGYTIGDGIAAMDRVAARILDETFDHDLAGASRDFMESSSSLAFAFVLALLIVYLVLAAQFESFRDPLIIMFTVPLALAGALLSLWYFNQTINIFSQIGLIMLIGLVTKNGILIVEFANQRKARGLSTYEAIVDASVTRLRPILMTSFSTILGTLPIALALGAGSESRVPMGIAVIGGLVFSTFLSLFIVPAIYTYITRAGSTISLADMDDQELEKVENIN